MNIVLINGIWASTENPILNFSNRSFLYGDGLFESMLWKDARLHLPEEHIARLKRGMQLFEMKIPEFLDAGWLAENTKVLIGKNAITGMARVRLNIFREGGGVYTPQMPDVKYVLSGFPIKEDYSSPVRTMGVFHSVTKPKGELSNYKTTSSAVYVLAGLFARKNSLDDAFILNTDGNITDAVSSNVFIIKDDKLITPPLTDGCLDGVMRKFILANCHQSGLKGMEKSVTISMVEEADEVFLTNAVARIRSVLQFAEKKFKTDITGRLKAEILP